jgi:hypothetical protein
MESRIEPCWPRVTCCLSIVVHTSTDVTGMPRSPSASARSTPTRAARRHGRCRTGCGIAAARPGARIGDISHAIQTTAVGAGYGLPDGLTGHGIGTAMHEDPSVPNTGRPGRGMPLREGLVIAIEPMLMAGGGRRSRTRRDGWTVATADGSRAAHAEHTVAITPDGPVILTLPDLSYPTAGWGACTRIDDLLATRPKRVADLARRLRAAAGGGCPTSPSGSTRTGRVSA